MERNQKPIVYVDTHIVTRMAAGQLNDLSKTAINLIDTGCLFYSPMVKLELHYLYERKEFHIHQMKFYHIYLKQLFYKSAAHHLPKLQPKHNKFTGRETLLIA